MYSTIFKLHAATLKALANPKRLEIINLLRDEVVNVRHMEEMLGLPQANLSQHLSVLRKLSLVTSERKGKEIYYKISHPNIIKASDLIREILVDTHVELKSELQKDIKKLLPLVHDPVCDMRISPKLASYHTSHENQNYFFCAEGCLKKFTKNPKLFLK